MEKMSRQECDVLMNLNQSVYVNQRELSDRMGRSLGSINKNLQQLIQMGYLHKDMTISNAGKQLLERSHPERAIILAAGFGMRMVPINTESPKAFLKVKGEYLIERQIKQLHTAGISEIYIVVGFMKEQFDYLIDKYHVHLIVNSSYSVKNNLYSLTLADKHLENAYIIPSDVWAADNPFRSTELYSWYMVTDDMDFESTVRLNRYEKLVPRQEHQPGNRMIGIAYITSEDADTLSKRLERMSQDHSYDNAFWEEALNIGKCLMINGRKASSDSVIEINTYEQLREIDSNAESLQNQAIQTIADVFHCQNNEIHDIQVLKKGMTNRSFSFICKSKKYIMRVPGEGTDQMISRRQEADVYQTISGKDLCDDPIYLNPENGYKITSFIEDVRVADPHNELDLIACMQKLRRFHEMNLQVNHSFDIYHMIDYYESLWHGFPSVYRDHDQTKKNVLLLRPYIEDHIDHICLTHIDANPDNFLFDPNASGERALQLTDWEYAGMQDPHVDVAMFIIYSLYNREQADHLINLYFQGSCSAETRTKIYCYIATCGLLWSDWCEYKSHLGVEFGEYSLAQYRYAKDYFHLAADRIGLSNQLEEY